MARPLAGVIDGLLAKTVVYVWLLKACRRRRSVATANASRVFACLSFPKHSVAKKLFHWMPFRLMRR